MHKASLLAILVALSAIWPAEGRLGRPRRVVPPRYGPMLYSYLEAQSYDAKNFLFTILTNTSIDTGTQPVVLVGPDGTQLTDPVFVPLAAKPIGITDGIYIFTLGDSFLRISAEGELLDDAPLPLPVDVQAGAAGPRRFLVIGEGESFLVDPHGNALPAGPVPGYVADVAVKDRVFAISTLREGKWYLRMLDDEGVVLRDGPAPSGVGSVASDGATWLLGPTSISLPHRIADDDLNVLVTFDERTLLFPLPGRGYLGINDRVDLFPQADRPAQVFEVRAGPYATQKTTLFAHAFRGSAIRGNGHALLYLDRRVYPNRPHIFSSIAELNGSLPPPFPLTGGVDREAPVAATNSAGVSLLAWNEPEQETSSAVYAARVSATGALLDAHPVLLLRDCRGVRSAIATDGTDFLVAWSGCSQAGAYLFTAEGTATQSFAATKSPSSISNHPAVAFDGESYIVVWPDLSRLAFARVLRNGSPVQPAMARMTGWSPQIAARPGGGSLLVYIDPELHRLTSQALTPDAALTGEKQTVDRGLAEASSLIRRDDHFLLVARSPGSDGEPFLIRLDERGKPSSRAIDIPIGTATPRLFCEAECTLVWREGGYTEPGRIVAAPIREPAPDGLVLGDPVTVATHDTIFRIGEPVLLRGAVDDPRLLLYTAPDAESGAVQIFARSAASKRRASRP